MCVGAVLAAFVADAVGAGVLLGLALATKQWAALAALRCWPPFPPAGCAASALTAGIGRRGTHAPAGFWKHLELLGHDATGGLGRRARNPFNAAVAAGAYEDRVISVGDDQSVVTVRALPRWLAHLVHPAIVLLAVPLTLLWWRSPRRTPDDVLALLALLFLMRSLLDPVNNAYYHVPFLLALIAWEGLTRRGPPLLSLVSSATIYYTIYKAGWTDDVAVATPSTWPRPFP